MGVRSIFERNSGIFLADAILKSWNSYFSVVKDVVGWLFGQFELQRYLPDRGLEFSAVCIGWRHVNKIDGTLSIMYCSRALHFKLLRVYMRIFVFLLFYKIFQEHRVSVFIV